MKKCIVLAIAMMSIFIVSGCGGNSTSAEEKSNTSSNVQVKNDNNYQGETAENKNKADGTNTEGEHSVKGTKVKITVGDNQMVATLEDNAASRALVKKLPMTLPMQNLYSREMCYRYGAGSLPTENLRSDRYEIGDIVYWPPRGSFVILYSQNGEQFERQQIGHIDKGIEVFNNIGETNVTFELMK